MLGQEPNVFMDCLVVNKMLTTDVLKTKNDNN